MAYFQFLAVATLLFPRNQLVQSKSFTKLQWCAANSHGHTINHEVALNPVRKYCFSLDLLLILLGNIRLKIPVTVRLKYSRPSFRTHLCCLLYRFREVFLCKCKLFGIDPQLSIQVLTHLRALFFEDRTNKHDKV